MNKNEKFLIGAVGALLTGIAIGLLVAPKDGKQTRKLIKNKANDFGGKTKDKFEKSVDELAQLSEKLKAGISEKYENVKHKATDMAGTVSEKVKGTVNS
ncbi:YtxH-like protein [Dyadobacter jejuensis]|uniref:YtxH-like protein n=1 Tax=Dyadobacter jejuensis TaxID=1082580 RepID=A0A316AK50_9BACT|nr:YtxH domain-containing protein [Dyadobacter jejuensis]PWJ57639.1 YtxH-like protein [Dyadobacter jejuensis]